MCLRSTAPVLLAALFCVMVSSDALAMLNPRIGRFMQRDPMGYVDGMSQYAAHYVAYGASDPMGLEMVSKEVVRKLSRETLSIIELAYSQWTYPVRSPNDDDKCCSETEAYRQEFIWAKTSITIGIKRDATIYYFDSNHREAFNNSRTYYADRQSFITMFEVQTDADGPVEFPEFNLPIRCLTNAQALAIQRDAETDRKIWVVNQTALWNPGKLYDLYLKIVTFSDFTMRRLPPGVNPKEPDGDRSPAPTPPIAA